MIKYISIFLILIMSSAMAQSQALTDTTVAMIAFWAMDDETPYAFKQTEEVVKDGKKTVKESTYDMTMEVIDSTENNFLVRWTYDNYKLNYELAPFEKEIMEVCENIPIEFTTDEFGRFKTIANWKEMKHVAERAFSNWLSSHEALPDSISRKIKLMVTSLFVSEEQMKYWARDIRFFHYLYGANLYRNKPMQGVKNYTNPLLRNQMPGTERIEVVLVDEENMIAQINVESGISGEASRQLMYDFILANKELYGIRSDNDVKKKDIPAFEVQEKLICLYDIETGYILSGAYSKKTLLKNDYKLTTYEYRLKGEDE